MNIQFSNYIIKPYTLHNKDELTNLLSNCEDGYILLGEEVEQFTEFYAVVLHSEFNGLQRFGIGICSEGHGLVPTILPQPELSKLLLGFNSTAVAIDIKKKQLVSEVELDSLFYAFMPWGNKEITIVVHEIGIVALNSESKPMWHFEKDVITNAVVSNGSLHVEFMDDVPVNLNVFGELLPV